MFRLTPGFPGIDELGLQTTHIYMSEYSNQLLFGASGEGTNPPLLLSAVGLK